jgi:uncharacterized BrkB/YihY/UPF0761 family membrane protein
MSKSKHAEASGSGALTLALFYLVSSYFAALIFSILFRRARANGRWGIGWALLCLICIAIFGYLSMAYVATSSPTHDAFWYYLGWSSLCANGLAAFIFLISIFKKSS